METTDKVAEEESVGVAMTAEKSLRHPAVTLGETVDGEAQLLLAYAAALGECVLQPAEAWLHSGSPGSYTLKLNFFPLKASSPPSCQKCLFFPFFPPSSACEGLHFPLIETLLVLGLYPEW